MKALIHRHLLCYLRDRWAVFFSFLSVMIILVLFVLFLGNVQQSSVPQHLQGTSEGDYLVYSWILSGLIVVASVTVPLGFLHVFIKDRVERAMDDFYVSPLSRTTIVLSYMLAALFAGVMLSTLSFIATMVVLRVIAGTVLPLGIGLSVMGLLVLSNMLFTALFFFVSTYLLTLNAHANLSTLVGTLIGFVGGLYVPVGAFSRTFQTVLNSFPPMQMASLMRTVYMREAIDSVFPTEASAEEYRLFFGVDIRVGDTLLSAPILTLILGGWTILFTVLSIIRLRRFKRT